jgi:hypothetical protein
MIPRAIVAVVCLAAFGAVLAGQANLRSSVPAIVRRAADYVDRFQSQFGSVVAEERYEQNMRQIGGLRTGFLGQSRTVLRSDFLLVKQDGGMWVPFRDVFERDGKAVRDRQDRLTKLFLDGATASAMQQAQRIMNESARYNLGNGTRTINVPTLPLMFLAHDMLGSVAYSLAKSDDAAPGQVVTFKEVGTPTLIHTTNDRDLPAEGKFWIDEETGAITHAVVRAADDALESEVTVTFQPDSALGIWVPVRMEERFRRRRDPVEARGVATYSNFRRFKVSTSETLDTNDAQDPAPK